MVAVVRLAAGRLRVSALTVLNCLSLLGERYKVLGDPSCEVREGKFVSDDGNHYFFTLCIGYAPEGLSMASKEENERHPAGSFVPVVKRVG